MSALLNGVVVMAKVFFDLDGTIINSQKRLYMLFCELCPENKFTYQEYWKIKRTHMIQKDFLRKYFNYSDNQIVAFNKSYLKRVEEPDLIAMDCPVDGIEVVLRQMRQKHTLYVVTNRQDYEETVREIDRLAWRDIFEHIWVTEQRNTKAELITRHTTVSPQDVFISDTGEDIKTARQLGIRSVAVTWGVLNREVLSSYQPDMIFDVVSDLKKMEELFC